MGEELTATSKLESPTYYKIKWNMLDKGRPISLSTYQGEQ